MIGNAGRYKSVPSGVIAVRSPRNTTMNKDIFFVDSIKSPILKKGKNKSLRIALRRLHLILSI